MTTPPQPLVLRDSVAADVAACAEIYREAVRNGTGTFELEEPDDAEMGRRRDAILAQGLPAQQTLETMLEEALALGGRDNITALLLELGDPAFPLPLADEPIRVVEPAVPQPEPPDLLARLGRILGRNS